MRAFLSGFMFEPIEILASNLDVLFTRSLFKMILATFVLGLIWLISSL